MGDWYIYIIRCGEGTLYTGIAKDVARRYDEHRLGGARGSRYLRGRTLAAVEGRAKTNPDWTSVERMIAKYGPPRHNVAFQDWKKEPEPCLKSSSAG